MQEIRTKDDFRAFVQSVEDRKGYERPEAFAIGVRRVQVGATNRTLDVWYPYPNVKENFGTAAVLRDVARPDGESSSVRVSLQDVKRILRTFFPFIAEPGHANIQASDRVHQILSGDVEPFVEGVVTFIGDLQKPPKDVEDVYLRLHLLSHRKVRPNAMNLDGIFGLLPNVAWTTAGPFVIEDLDTHRANAWSQRRQLTVLSVDKFPRMVDYVVPSGVRIADADRVRLGAFLGEGTTVMHEGFVNFNAGTEGPDNMVEGRISAGVWVGAGSDLGGGSSTMGTLSGGGKERVSVGRNCLIGANAGVGIALGDRCTVEAGLYVTAGTRVKKSPELYDTGQPAWVKAKDLSGQSDLLFRRNSETGAVEVSRNPKPNKPNVVLHTNQ